MRYFVRSDRIFTSFLGYREMAKAERRGPTTKRRYGRTGARKRNAKVKAALKTDRERTTQRGKFLFYSNCSLTLMTHDARCSLALYLPAQLTKLTGGKDRSIYKTTTEHSRPFLPSFHGSQQWSILFHACSPFPSVKNYYTNKGEDDRYKENFFMLYSLQASDSFLPALHQFQAHIRRSKRQQSMLNSIKDSAVLLADVLI